MAETVFEQAKEELGVHQLHPPIKSGKFATARMSGFDGRLGFLKFAIDPESNAWEDLEYEALWAQQHRSGLEERGVITPEVLAHDPNYNWVLFEFLSISYGPFNTAGNWREAASVASSIFSLPLEREPVTDLKAWYTNNVARVADKAGLLFRGLPNRDDYIKKLEALANGEIDISCLTAGVVHGDLKDDHIPLTAKGTALLDGEHGTLKIPPSAIDGRKRTRTQHDKPRFHDIGYYYHLLWQTVGAMEARGFIHEVNSRLKQDGLFDGNETEREFKLSAIERTASMALHFVINQSQSRVGEDVRRRRAPRYGSLLANLLIELE